MRTKLVGLLLIAALAAGAVLLASDVRINTTAQAQAKPKVFQMAAVEWKATLGKADPSWGEGQPSKAACEGLVRFKGDPEIVFVEYALKPNCLEVQPGRITFVLKNEGRSTHDFRIEGEGIDVRSTRFGPGRTLRFEVELEEGEYKISCPLSNHAERGMVGTLIVKPEARACPCTCAGLDQHGISEDRFGKLLSIC